MYGFTFLLIYLSNNKETVGNVGVDFDCFFLPLVSVLNVVPIGYQDTKRHKTHLIMSIAYRLITSGHWF